MAFQYIPPTMTYASMDPQFQSGLLCEDTGSDAYDLDEYAAACYTPLTAHETEEVNHLLMLPLDLSDWPFESDDLEKSVPTMTISGSSSSSSSHPLAVEARLRRARSPEEVELRRQHRRSMQKGYEKGYRQRKKVTRDVLRQQWLNLEWELKFAVQDAQSRQMLWQGVGISAQKTQLEQAQAEARALCTEKHVLQAWQRSEERLSSAMALFTQPSMREKMNELSSKPRLFQFEFEWE